MEESPLSLDKWAVALWLKANAKNNISSYLVHLKLGITQKSALFMQHRIRLALHGTDAGTAGGQAGVGQNRGHAAGHFVRRSRLAPATGCIFGPIRWAAVGRHKPSETNMTSRPLCRPCAV